MLDTLECREWQIVAINEYNVYILGKQNHSVRIYLSTLQKFQKGEKEDEGPWKDEKNIF